MHVDGRLSLRGGGKRRVLDNPRRVRPRIGTTWGVKCLTPFFGRRVDDRTALASIAVFN